MALLTVDTDDVENTLPKQCTSLRKFCLLNFLTKDINVSVNIVLYLCLFSPCWFFYHYISITLFFPLNIIFFFSEILELRSFHMLLSYS